MTIWIDAQLSPTLAGWIKETFSVNALALRDATDREIFFAARKASAVVMTKDMDFLNLLEESGPPPQVIWVTCGTHQIPVSNKLLSRRFLSH